MGGVFNEPRFFLAGVALPIDARGVWSIIDEPGLNFLMVMEDITARGGGPPLRNSAVDRRTGHAGCACVGALAQCVLG